MVDAVDFCLDDAHLFVEVRVVDPQIQAAPLERAVGVEAFIALQTDKVGIERSREDLGYFSLADSGLAFDQHRLAQLHGQVNGRGDGAVGDVVLGFELGLNFGNLRQQVKGLQEVRCQTSEFRWYSPCRSSSVETLASNRLTSYF